MRQKMKTGNALERETWLKERGLVEESEDEVNLSYLSDFQHFDCYWI